MWHWLALKADIRTEMSRVVDTMRADRANNDQLVENKLNCNIQFDVAGTWLG